MYYFILVYGIGTTRNGISIAETQASQQVKNRSEWEQKGNGLLKLTSSNFPAFIPQLSLVSLWNTHQTELVQCAGYWSDWVRRILNLHRRSLFSALAEANFLFPDWFVS